MSKVQGTKGDEDYPHKIQRERALYSKLIILILHSKTLPLSEICHLILKVTGSSHWHLKMGMTLTQQPIALRSCLSLHGVTAPVTSPPNVSGNMGDCHSSSDLATSYLPNAFLKLIEIML
jgi:hypothetical protein